MSNTVDTRYVYGFCTWHDYIQKAGNTGPQKHTIPSQGPGIPPREVESRGLPCCPFCGSMLMEAPSKKEWMDGAEDFEKAGHPGYVALVEWGEGKCFPDFDTAICAYNLETGENYPPTKNLKKATLVKKNTSDGVSYIKEEVPLGKVYYVDVDSIQSCTFAEGSKEGAHTTRKCISVLRDDHKSWGLMPLELISIEQ